MRQQRNILPPKRDSKRASLNFRLTDTEAKAFREKLKREGRKPQHFFEALVRAYLDGKLS